MTLNDQQLDRYARHIVLRDIGGAGQSKLLSSHVLLIGAGGIGCPAIQYLAAAGVGTISVVDDDDVALSNLQRQILYSDRDIGTAKVEAAGAAAAWLGAPLAVQLAVSALVGGGAVWWWHRRRAGAVQAPESDAPADPNQLDVGAVVMVQAWQPDGQTRVHYRGSEWLAHRAPGTSEATGPHRIVAVASNHLVLTPVTTP